MAYNPNQQAKNIHDLIEKTFQSEDLKYTEVDAGENYHFRLKFSGEDLPMDLSFFVDTKRQLIRVVSYLPVHAPKDKFSNIALALAIINYRLNCGCFNLDLSDGSMSFCLNATFKGSIIAADIIQSLLATSLSTIEKYNDKLFMLSKGMIKVEDI